MSEYYRNHRLVPLGFAAAMTLPVGAGVWCLTQISHYDALAGSPMFVVFGYALMGAYLNKSWVRVNAKGVDAGCGPIPMFHPPAGAKRNQIAKVYVRHAILYSKVGSVTYLAAGVRRTDGRCVDISRPMLEDDLVWREAELIAKALGWEMPVEEIMEEPRQRNWDQWLTLLSWASALAASLLWGVFVDHYLRR